MERLKLWSNVRGVGVEPIMEPLAMQPIMEISEAPPSQREVRSPNSSLGGIS